MTPLTFTGRTTWKTCQDALKNNCENKKKNKNEEGGESAAAAAAQSPLSLPPPPTHGLKGVPSNRGKNTRNTINKEMTDFFQRVQEQARSQSSPSLVIQTRLLGGCTTVSFTVTLL